MFIFKVVLTLLGLIKKEKKKIKKKNMVKP